MSITFSMIMFVVLIFQRLYRFLFLHQSLSTCIINLNKDILNYFKPTTVKNLLFTIVFQFYNQNLKSEHKRNVLKSLSIAESMYKEILLLRKRLTEETKRKRDILEEGDVDIMEFDNNDNSPTEPTNIRSEINEMKNAISKLTKIVQNNIGASTSTSQRPPIQ